MTTRKFKYVIVGAGLSGCKAIEGIRSLDSQSPILLASAENYLPYDRPPLSKKLWFGKKKVEEIFIHPKEYFKESKVDCLLNVRAVKIDPDDKIVAFDNGSACEFEKLLIATGGSPRRLDIEGGSHDDIFYYRYLDDYLRLKSRIHQGTKALVIGGGFIGSEIAAALNINKADVTMLIRGNYLVENVFPKPLGMAIQEDFINRGVKILTHDAPVSIEKPDGYFITRTKAGKEITSDVVITGIGIEPETHLAKSANLKIENGIVVNEFLQTSSPDIYAAGDNTCFPYQALDRYMRVEHWDNAVNQGLTAGMNMAGAGSAYTHMPYFFSDLFDFGYEAVGLVDSRLETHADWQKENNTGVIYYLENGFVRGVMCCNVWDKIDAARELIKSNRKITPDKIGTQLLGAIK
jgi:NADPH-dependent 2,4-dienoyl-CoA reductase/sulfur reductase-like enzyme